MTEINEEDFLDFLRDQMEGGNIEKSAVERIKDYLQDNDSAGWHPDEESPMDYVDEDYQNMGDVEIAEAEDFLDDELEDAFEEITDELNKKFELTDAETEDMIDEAIRRYTREDEECDEEDLEKLEDDFTMDSSDIEKISEDT